MNRQSLLTSIKALAACIVTASLLLFVFAFISLKADDPSKNLDLYAYISILVSTAVGAVFCTKAEDRIASALVFSAGFTVLSILIGCVFGEIFKKPLFTAVCYILVFLVPLVIAKRSARGGRRKNRSRRKYLRSR